MTRLLLTCLGVAALQLGTPHAAGAAEQLRPGGEPTRVVPQLETKSQGALTRDGSRTAAVKVAHVTPGAPAEPPRLPRASAYGTVPTEAPHCLGPASLPRVLPDARAPPA
jgi:hypothetical protein